jgi:hypothetical protein
MGKIITKRFWLGLVIAALSLINVIFAQPRTTKPMSNHPGYGPSEITLSKKPKIGETVKLTFSVTSRTDIKHARIKFNGVEGVEFISGEGRVERLNGKTARIYYHAQKDVINSFSIYVKAKSSPFRVDVTASVPWKDKSVHENPGSPFGLNLIHLLLIDSLTGQLGTIEEYNQHPIRRILMYYNHYDGEWLNDPDPSFEITNRKIVVGMRKFEPALSDSEALALHGDMIQGIMFGIGVSKKDASKPAKEVEDMIIKYLLKEGWLGKLRNGTKDKWFQKLKKDSKEKWDKSENSKEGSKYTFVFSGQWKYKKHAYNKDQGLLTATQDALVRQSKVRVRAYWLGSGTNWYACYTDVNGNFAVTGYDIPIDRNIYTHPILYTWNYDNIVKVSDPTPSTSTWRDPADTTIWYLNRAGSNVDTVWGGSGGHSFGSVYPESLKTGITQPKSGAVNIYEALLTGYKKLVPTYTNAATLGPVRALWEPGYNSSTGYIRDTIWVLGSSYDTDEWDDMVLLHEYGHHVMNKCAATPPNSVDSLGHYWHVSDTSFKNQAYSEGWADMLPSFITDSIYYVDTKKGINSATDTTYWHNTENPWEFSALPSDSFQGGPWCEGAVAGAMWDMVDYNDEVPYTSYPATGWPDTSLADSLDGGFWNVWNIFSKYNPYNYSTSGYFTRCQNIFHVISGWDNNLVDSTGIYCGSGYGHPKALKQIATHHRIKPAPAAPSGVTASTKNGVKITWRQNTDGGIYKYMVFRWNYLGMQTGYTFYRLTPATTDTFYNDNPPAGTNTYYVIAVDTNRTESEPSSWVTVITTKGMDEAMKSSATEMLSINPNPSTGKFMFRYQLANPGRSTVKVYNTLGQVVKTLVDQDQQSGIHSVNWDGKDDQGRQAAAGVYVYRIHANGYDDTKRLVILK